MLLSLRREHAATVLLLDNGSCLCNVCAHCVECVWQTVNFELRAICFYLKWFWMVCHTLRAAGTGCSVGSLANLGSLQRKRVWLARQEVIVTTNYSAELVMASMLVWSLSIIRTWNARHATVVLINGFLALVLVRWSSNRTKVYWCVGFKNHGFCTFIPQYSRVTALYISLSAHRNKPKKSSYERIWDNVFSYDCGAPWRYSKSIPIRPTILSGLSEDPDEQQVLQYGTLPSESHSSGSNKGVPPNLLLASLRPWVSWIFQQIISRPYLGTSHWWVRTVARKSSIEGLYVRTRGASHSNLTKIPLTCSVSYFNLGGISPPIPRDGTVMGINFR